MSHHLSLHGTISPIDKQKTYGFAGRLLLCCANFLREKYHSNLNSGFDSEVMRSATWLNTRLLCIRFLLWIAVVTCPSNSLTYCLPGASEPRYSNTRMLWAHSRQSCLFRQCCCGALSEIMCSVWSVGDCFLTSIMTCAFFNCHFRLPDFLHCWAEVVL